MKKMSPLQIDQLNIFFYWIVEQRRETIEQFYIRSNENFLEHELLKERLPDKVVFRARTADKTMFVRLILPGVTEIQTMSIFSC